MSETLMVRTGRERHLTAAEMDVLLFPAGTDSAGNEEVAEHLRSCAACAGELAELRGSIGLLREAATGLARNQGMARERSNRIVEFPAVARIRSVRTIPLALAASLLVGAALVPVVQHNLRREAPATVVAVPMRSVADDEALLREIDEQLSAEVPNALEPLANPVKTTNTSAHPSDNYNKPQATTKD